MSMYACFQILAIIYPRLCVGLWFRFSWVPRRGTSGLYLSMCSSLYCTAKRLHHCAFASLMYTISSGFMCSATVNISVVKYSSGCVLVPYCCFNLHFSHKYWCWAYFLCLMATYLYLFLHLEVYDQIVWLFLIDCHWIVIIFWLLSCKTPTYILDINSVSDIYFQKMFSKCTCLHIIFVMSSRVYILICHLLLFFGN